MKQRTKWLAGLFVAASASLLLAGPSYGCGCHRLAPVRERIVQSNFCTFEQPVAIQRTTSCVMESPSSTAWSEPSNPGLTVGSVISAPFRAVGSGLAWSGRTLSGQPEYVGSREYIEPVGQLEPVGERFTTVTTTKTFHHKYLKRHMLRKISYSNSMLMPVGERFTTVKTFRSKTMLEPIGEKITTVKTFHRRVLLEPVGEKITTIKYLKMRPVLEPVGERILIRNYSPWYSCD